MKHDYEIFDIGEKMNNMTTLKISTIILLILLSGISICSGSIEFTDSSGQKITLSKPAERIICLNSDIAETLVALGAGDKIVGLTEIALYDTALMKHIPKAMSIGEWQTPGIERILALKSDAVISYSSSKPKNSDQLTNAGIKLIYLDCYKFNTLEQDIKAVGTMIGAESKADVYVSFLKKWKDKVISGTENIFGDNIPSVYIEGYSDYSAQGKDSGIDNLMEIAKGENLAAGLGEQWPKVTPEWVISENPDIIIKTASLKSDKNLARVRENILTRTGFEVLDAIRNKQVYVINSNIIYGPRSPAGLVYLAKILHPEEFRDLNPADVLKEYAENFVPGVETGEYYSPDL